MIKIRSLLRVIFTILLFVPYITMFGQVNKNNGTASDSLSLANVMQSVMQSHPSIKLAEEALNTANAKIGLAKSGYYPTIDITGSYSHVGPVPSIDFPGLGAFQLFPSDNVDASVNIHQTIYDFGRTSNLIKMGNSNKSLSEQNIDLVKNKLLLLTINAFFSLEYIQEAIRIKDEELKTLQEQLASIEKKLETGSATKYELLTTKVKISTTSNQKVDLETAQKTQWSILKNLTSSTAFEVQKVKKEMTEPTLALVNDSLLTYAYNHRIEMAQAKEKESMAQLNYAFTKTMDNPTLFAMAKGGVKNGYVPDLGAIKPNYMIGVGLNIPIFDGTRKKYNHATAQSQVASSGFDTEITQKIISNEVIELNDIRIAAKDKINQNMLQVDQAKEAYSLAQISFKTGSITNVELLDSETKVSESRLLLLKAQIDYIVSSYKLKIALGDRL